MKYKIRKMYVTAGFISGLCFFESEKRVENKEAYVYGINRRMWRKEGERLLDPFDQRKCEMVFF